MPGKGCQERKAERRKLKRVAEAPEGEEPASKRRAEAEFITVPDINDLTGDDLDKRLDLLKCLAEAIREYDRGEGVAGSALGTHYKVHAAKKDPCFSNMRLSDIIEAHPELFEVAKEDDSQILHKSTIKLVDAGVEAVLGVLALEEADESGLPSPINDPPDREQALQAMRIEVIRSLHKRADKSQLNDIGQEPPLQRLRSKWMKDTKLLDIVKQFPNNFGLEDQGHGNFIIELLSGEIDETEMLQGRLPKRNHGQSKPRSEGKGKGKGKGKKGMPMMPWMGGGGGQVIGMLINNMMGGWGPGMQGKGYGKGGW